MNNAVRGGSEGLDRSDQPVYVVLPHDSTSGVDLHALGRTLWNRRWLILIVAMICTAVGGAYALLADPVYRVEVTLSPTKPDQSSGLSTRLAGLASLAGIAGGAGSEASDALAFLRSRVFIEEFISENDLLTVLFAEEWDEVNSRWVGSDPSRWPDLQDGVELFVNSVRFVTERADLGLIVLAIEWTDPKLATSWAEELVSRANQQIRNRVLAESERKLTYLRSELDRASLVELRDALARLIEEQLKNIMLAHAEDEYAFKVIDPARLPTDPVKPRRVLILFLSALAGLLLGSLLAIVQHIARPEQCESEGVA